METRIKILREDHDLTQKQLSSLLNISQVAYSYYELEKRSIPLELLSKLADFYETSVDYLLYRTDEYICIDNVELDEEGHRRGGAPKVKQKNA